MSEIPEEQLPFVSGNVIAASAGTGKTYQLASRFLALMALGEDPGAMVALTFTKKAAGEFRNRIFKTLADGALNVHDKNNPDDDPNRNPLAQRLIETLSGWKVDAKSPHGQWSLTPAGNPVPLMPTCGARIGADAFVRQVVEEHNAHPETCIYPEMLCRDRLHLPDNLTEVYFCRLLEKLVKASGRLTLSTIDSFFQRLVAANCFDVGLSSVQTVTGEDFEQAKLDAALALLDDVRGEAANFFRIYRDVTGEKENNMLQQLQDNAEAYSAKFRQMPEAEEWSNGEAFALPPVAVENASSPTLDFAYYYYELPQLAPDAAIDKKLRKALYEKDFKTLNEYTYRENPSLKELLKSARLILSRSISGETITPAEWAKFEAESAKVPVQECLQKMLKSRSAPQKTLAGELMNLPNALSETDSPLLAEFCRLEHLIDEALQDMVQKTLAKTAGMYRLMQRYSEVYKRSILNSGRLSFDDITALAKQVLERDDVPTETAQDLDVRLRHWMLDEFQDTNQEQMDTLNTMLQDVLTSRDAAEFNREGHPYDARQASLFVVGDVKQSIYSFRGGTPEILKGMLPDAQGKPSEVWGRLMQHSELQQSFRSSPVIMDFVNELFRGMRNSLDKAGNEWLPDREHVKSFAGHSAAKKTMPGYVRVTMLPKAHADEDDSEFGAACEQVKQILTADLTDAKENGHVSALKGDMSVGILVRKNEEVDKLYRYLRKEFGKEAPLYMVSDNFIAIGSPMGEWLLAFFLWLEHPADAFRRGIVLESAIGAALLPPVEGEDKKQKLIRELSVHAQWRNLLAAKGYKATLQELLRVVDAAAVDVATARTWLQAAQDFDIAGGDTEAWIRFIRQRSYQSIPPEKSIQIMTMHKSKGLEFDAVILPLIGLKGVDDTGKMQHFIHRPSKSILLSPGGDNQRQGLPKLGCFVDAWKAERRCEEYNLMYVAVTRAKRALFVLLHSGAQPFEAKTKVSDHHYLDNKPQHKNSDFALRSLKLHGKFVRVGSKFAPTYGNDTTAVILYESRGVTGTYRYDADSADPPRTVAQLGHGWCSPLVKAKQEKAEAAAVEQRNEGQGKDSVNMSLPARACQPRKVSPSKLAEEGAAPLDEASSAYDAGKHQVLKVTDTRFATDFGTDVHACFEEIEWLEEGTPLRLKSENKDAVDAVETALKKPEIAAVFRRPNERTFAYNEQDIDAMDEMEGQQVWVSGIIDRLVAEYAADGKKVVRAAIYDYKTNRIQEGHDLVQHDAALREHYRQQMDSYRRLIAKMFGLAEQEVSTTLIAVPSNACTKAHLVPLSHDSAMDA